MLGRYTRLTIAIAALAPLSALLTTTTAHAATPAPFTITEQIDLTTDPANLTFTATGPLYPSGVFTDDQAVAAGHANPPGVFNAVSYDVYTCDDGSGTFDATKLNHIRVGDSGLTNAGQIQLRGGTGAYMRLVGHGVDNGTFSYEMLTGIGNISGVIAQS